MSRVCKGVETRASVAAREEVWGIPAYCPDGVRHIGGVSSVQAVGWNAGTCRPDAKGEPQAFGTVRGRVPMRGTGAGRPVVVMKPGNARGAKGAGYPLGIRSTAEREEPVTKPKSFEIDREGVA